MIVIAYSIHDQFIAHSFDTDLFDLVGAIRTWLYSSEAVGYLLIRRASHGSQGELPSPIGRTPMDRVTLTAATQHGIEVVSFFLEEIKGIEAYRLVPTKASYSRREQMRSNLLLFPDERPMKDTHAYFPEFEEFVAG